MNCKKCEWWQITGESMGINTKDGVEVRECTSKKIFYNIPSDIPNSITLYDLAGAGAAMITRGDFGCLNFNKKASD